MGCYDVWCPLCGAFLNGIDDQDLDQKEKRFVNKCKWLSKVTLLLPNKIITGTEEINCSSTFMKGGIEYNFWMDNDFNDGVALHDDCWRIGKKLGLTYKNFEKRRFKKDLYGFSVKGLDYKPIDKYWSQIFRVDKLLIDGNRYLLESPLKCKKNNQRVIKNIKILTKEKKEKRIRPSPEESATKFRIGAKKKGGDGNIWKVTKTKTGVKRWKRV